MTQSIDEVNLLVAIRFLEKFNSSGTVVCIPFTEHELATVQRCFAIGVTEMTSEDRQEIADISVRIGAIYRKRWQTMKGKI
jgi:hypothetical protein